MRCEPKQGCSTPPEETCERPCQGGGIEEAIRFAAAITHQLPDEAQGLVYVLW